MIFVRFKLRVFKRSAQDIFGKDLDLWNMHLMQCCWNSGCIILGRHFDNYLAQCLQVHAIYSFQCTVSSTMTSRFVAVDWMTMSGLRDVWTISGECSFLSRVATLSINLICPFEPLLFFSGLLSNISNFLLKHGPTLLCLCSLPLALFALSSSHYTIAWCSNDVQVLQSCPRLFQRLGPWPLSTGSRFRLGVPVAPWIWPVLSSKHWTLPVQRKVGVSKWLSSRRVQC